MPVAPPRFLRSFGAVCAAAGLLALVSVPCPAETLRGYSRLLSATSQRLRLLSASEQQRPGSQTQALKDLADSLPPSLRVTQPGGTSVDVRLEPIRDDLRIAAGAKAGARLSTIESVLGRVETLESAVGSTSRSSVASRERGKEALSSVLSRREYQRSRKEEFVQSLMRSIFDALDRLHMPSGVVDVLAWLLLAVAVIGFVIVLVVLVLKLVASITLGGRPEREIEEAQEPLKGPISLGSVLAEAEREALAGHYREAFRRVYLASILTLDRARLVKYADGLTNWEYLRALLRQDRPDAVAAFMPMTESFDQLIYGKRSVTERDYRECFRQYRALEEVL